MPYEIKRVGNKKWFVVKKSTGEHMSKLPFTDLLMAKKQLKALNINEKRIGGANGKADDIALSNFDLKNLLKQTNIHNPNIILTKDIKPNSNLFNNTGHAIMFHSWKGADTDVGHWVVATRNERLNQVFFFDSLATDVDEISPNLIPCLKSYGIPVFINLTKYQSDRSNVCGRYALLMIGFNKMNLDVEEIYKILDRIKEEYCSLDKYLLELFKDDK